MIELKTYAGSNVTPQNDAIMNDANTMNNGIYHGCNVTIKDATTLHITAGQGIIYGRVFEVVDSDIPVSLSTSGVWLGQLYVHIDLSNIAAPIQILVDTGETLATLEDDDQLNIDSGITDMQLATFNVSTVGISDLVETYSSVQQIRAVVGNKDISAIGDGSIKGAIKALNADLSQISTRLTNYKQVQVIDKTTTVALTAGQTLSDSVSINTPSGYSLASVTWYTTQGGAYISSGAISSTSYLYLIHNTANSTVTYTVHCRAVFIK